TIGRVATNVACTTDLSCIGTDSCPNYPSCPGGLLFLDESNEYQCRYPVQDPQDPEQWRTEPADYSRACRCLPSGVCGLPRAMATELHPFTGAMWSHPTAPKPPVASADGGAPPDPEPDFKIWIRALSHEPFPVGGTGGVQVGDQTFFTSLQAPENATRLSVGAVGPAMTTTFHLRPLGQSPPDEKLYIGPIMTDCALVPA